MKESIHISNFAGIQDMDLELSSIVVLIGPQASGKSVTVKLLFFFKSFFFEIFRSTGNQESKKELDKRQLEKFALYFPKESWPKDSFRIIYSVNASFISIEKTPNNQLKIDYSENIKTVVQKGRQLQQQEQKRILQDPTSAIYATGQDAGDEFDEIVNAEISDVSAFRQLFVPAGRSFFANIQSSVFSLLSENQTLDPFLLSFGASYEFYKMILRAELEKTHARTPGDFDELLTSILNGRYAREGKKDYLIHTDNRKVNLSNASSGQQEILPLLLILKARYLFVFRGAGITLYIEEPEAHLFPGAQKKIVQLLARVFNRSKDEFQIIVTTHSPYILSSFNNLIQAGRLENDLDDDDKLRLYEMISREEIIKPSSILAYSMNEGKAELLMDHETQLISGDILDSVSNDISVEFGKMLDLEFGVK